MDEDPPASTNLVDKKQVEWFEDILDTVGTRGKFQFRLNLLAYFACALVSQAGQSHYYALFVQDHWCHVPGREFTNYTLEGWKNLTLPKLNGQYSKCLMHYATSDDAVACEHGWDYDDTWFSVTIPSENNWVCEKELVLSNSLCIVHGVATPLLWLLCVTGDRFGRRAQFALAVAALLVGRSVSALVPSFYVVFILMMTLGSMGHGPSVETIVTMGIEMTDAGNRNLINTSAMLSSALGKIECAMVAWSSRHYLSTMLATTLPLFFILCFIPWLPESPRWLLAKGRCEEAFDVLRRIAKVNGKSVPPETLQTLQRMSKRSGAKFGVATLFKDKYLRRNTLIILLSRFACGLTLSSIAYNLGNIPANPFVMHVTFAAMEVVSIVVLHFCIEHVGRRLSHGGIMAVSAVASFVQVLLLTVSPSSVALAVVTVLLSMLIASALIVAGLHSVEIHPTFVRQTSTAFEMVVFVAPMSVTPYLVYLHSAYDGRFLYGVLGLLQLASAVTTSFLPETTNRKLPQTLVDARFSTETEPKD